MKTYEKLNMAELTERIKSMSVEQVARTIKTFIGRLHSKDMEISSLKDELANRAEEEIVKTQNAYMAEILRRNGVKPSRLLITYIYQDCDRCGFQDEDGYIDCYGFGDFDGNEAASEICKYGKTIRTVECFTYEIDHGVKKWHDNFSGITGKYEEISLHVTKVVDRETGAVIFEEPEKDA